MILMSYGDSKNFLANPKPARIPPQTPPAGGTEAEAGRIHIPSQLFRPAESAFLSKKVRANVRITPPKPIRHPGGVLVFYMNVDNLYILICTL